MTRYLLKRIIDFNENIPEGLSDKFLGDEPSKAYKKREEYVLIQ